MFGVDSIIESLKRVFIKISDEISSNNPFKMSNILGVNSSNDNVKKLDIVSNEYIIEELLKNKNVRVIGSEENEDLIYTNNVDGGYLVCFDPLDGSSNIDSNITIGSIFSIFKAENVESSKIGDSLVCAGYCLYGGSTLLVYSKVGSSVDCYLLKDRSEFVKICELAVPKLGKIYSINECNRGYWSNNGKYVKLIEEFVDSDYTQRWVGSLVADGHRTIVKGGFFSYPGYKGRKGKLRLLYEAIPFCFIMEQSGGRGYLDDELSDWKEVYFPKDIHVRSPLILVDGSADWVLKKVFNPNRERSFS